MRVTLILIICVLTTQPVLGGDDDTRARAWAHASRFPHDLGLVAVIESPSDLLTSEEGTNTRRVIATTGLFSKTIEAWHSLGDFLGADSEEIVDLFFSERVAIAVEQWGGGGFAGFTQSIDGRWALVARVERHNIRRINELLDPVPRRLADGVPIYSIERGRFTLAVIPTKDALTEVVLVPSNREALAERLVRALKQPVNDDAETRAIPDATANPIAFVRLTDPNSDSHRLLELGKSDLAIELNFTSLYADPETPLGHAPIALLDSEREDAIAIAVFASGLTLDASGPFGLALSTSDAARPDPVLSPSGACLVVHEHPDRGEALEWSVYASGAPGTLDAGAADDWVERRYLSLASDPTSAFGGVLPGTVRTDEIPVGLRASGGLMGPHPSRVSWCSVSTSRGDALVLAFSDDPDRSARQAARIARAAELAAMLGDPQAPAGDRVLTKGWADASELGRALLSNAGPMLAPAAGYLGSLTWDVRHDEGLARGRITLMLKLPEDGVTRIGSEP